MSLLGYHVDTGDLSQKLLKPETYTISSMFIFIIASRWLHFYYTIIITWLTKY